jgi:hypothetical protein
MDCLSCKYKRDEPGTALKSCRAIKEHSAFDLLSLEQKGTLEISVAATGRFPYTTQEGEAIMDFNFNDTCHWPASFDPHDILICKFHRLKENAAEWVKID